MKRWLTAIKRELQARGLNEAVWKRCQALTAKANVLQLTAESQAAHIEFLEGQILQLKKDKQELCQAAFLADFTNIALRGELARAKGESYAIRN